METGNEANQPFLDKNTTSVEFVKMTGNSSLDLESTKPYPVKFIDPNCILVPSFITEQMKIFEKNKSDI